MSFESALGRGFFTGSKNEDFDFDVVYLGPIIDIN